MNDKRETIRTAIFWVIGKQIKLFVHRRDASSALSRQEEITDRIDCPLSHYAMWDIFGNKYPDADFATYPRGRILYDVKADEHVIFADKRINDYTLDKIAKKIDAKKYRIERDEHYACDD